MPGTAPLRFFALELMMIVPSGAVVFDKGCYIGQELTARTKFRGEVCSFCHTFSLAIPSACEKIWALTPYVVCEYR
jgi:folate-binding protein YgfZ